MRKLWRLSALSIAVLAVAAVVLLATVNRVRFDRLTGYYAPTFATDGRAVLFLERNVTGVSWGLGYEFFTGPAHNYVIADDLRLRRLSLDTGAISDIQTLPRLPTSGRHLRAYRTRLYHYLSADLRFVHPSQPDIRLRLSIPRVPQAEQFHYLREWRRTTFKSTETWQEGGAVIFPTSHQRVHGALELLTIPGAEALPCGIHLFDHAGGTGRYLLGEETCHNIHPQGYSREVLLQRSRYASVKKADELEKARQLIMEGFLGQGLNEADAAIATIAEMQRQGFYPKPTTLTAREVQEDELAARFGEDLKIFRISRTEFEVGLFQDIARSIAKPGVGIEKSMGRYVIHRDYGTSELLNRHLESKPGRFVVETGRRFYEITIDWRS